MEYFAKMPRPVPNREPRPFIVGYAPTRFHDKLSYCAKEIDPDLYKQGKISGSLPMAFVPLKSIEAVSEENAIAKVKDLLKNAAEAKGKTYAEFARRLTERYYGR